MVTNVFALDIGEKRIGIARANTIAKIPKPVATLKNDASFATIFKNLVKEHDVTSIVVGLPRNLSGEETEQSRYTRRFVLEQLSEYKVVFQDETLSSVAAEGRKEWHDHGIDAAAACIILDDYLLEK